MPPPRRSAPAAKKSLGQHFLHDLDVVNRIAAAVGHTPGVPVVEVGPGTGQLTEALLREGNTVRAIEIDDRMVGLLRKRFAGQPLTVVLGDARDVELERLAEPGEPYVVAGNLPYFAANPIIRRFLEAEHPPREMVVMVQREVARELAAPEGDTSLLSIATRLYAEAELLFTVPPEAFDPPPRVVSGVVRLRLRPEPLVPRERIPAFMLFVSRVFRNPRKQLHNGLARATHLDMDGARDAAAAAGIDSTRRAETLTFKEWISLMDTVEAMPK